MSHANVGQPLDKVGVARKERLLGDARHLAVDRFARQRIDHLDGFRADRPVDAKVGRLDLVARLGRCDQCEFRLVEDVGRWQALDDGFDASANGSGEMEKKQKLCTWNSKIVHHELLTYTYAPGAANCPGQSSASTPDG